MKLTPDYCPKRVLKQVNFPQSSSSVRKIVGTRNTYLHTTTTDTALFQKRIRGSETTPG